MPSGQDAHCGGRESCCFSSPPQAQNPARPDSLSQELKEGQYMRPGRKAKAREASEDAGEYEVIQLAEKVVPEVFMEEFLRESGGEGVYIQPDYVVSLAAGPIGVPEAGEPLRETPGIQDQTLKDAETEILEAKKTDLKDGEALGTKEAGTGLPLPQGSILGLKEDLRAAWGFSRGKGAVVALIDTGVDVTHPGLAGHMLPGYDFVNSREGVYDAALGMEQAHGTHIAGVIAGGAPEAKILPLKVFENGSAYTSDILQAVAYAKEQGASIVNMSFGGTDENSALREAMEGSGMFFVCAAGNCHKDLAEAPVYPAAFSLGNSISTGALNQDLGMSYFSNYGEDVDIAAWGRDVYGCFPGGGYGRMDGTSIAAGYVSAAAALAVGETGAEGLKERLMGTADRLTCLDGKTADGNKLSFSGAASGAVKEGVPEVTPEEDTDEGYGLSSPEEKWELFGSVRNTAIAAGSSHALALKENGQVWAWGYNRYGQLGDNTYGQPYQPERAKGISGITAVSAGGDYSLALKGDGTVYAWGNNNYGQLGGSASSDSALPARVTLPDSYGKVIKISAGAGHGLALTSDGSVLAWGSNQYGESGKNEKTNWVSPVKIAGLGNIVDISAGDHRSMALDSSGNAWAWGKDTPGHVGDGALCPTPVKIQTPPEKIKKLSSGCGGSSALVTSSGGYVWAWGKGYTGNYGGTSTDSQTPHKANTSDELIKGMQEVSVGRMDALMLRGDGQALGWGEHTNSGLGLGDIGVKNWAVAVCSGVQAVSAGGDFFLVLKGDGTIAAAGSNSYGQCGQGQGISKCQYLTEVELSENTSFATAEPLKANEAMGGELLETGERRYYSFTAPYTCTYTFESISGIDLYGELYESAASGEITAYNDDKGAGVGESTNNRDFYIEHAMEKGKTYYLAVRSYGLKYTGAYAVKVKYKDDCGDTAGNAKLISEGAANGTMDYPEDADMYRFVPAKTGYYEVQSISTYGLKGTLLDAGGGTISSSSQKTPDVGESSNSLDFYMYEKLTAGQSYYIRVEGSRYKELLNQTEYTVKVSYKDDYGNERAKAAEIQKEASVSGRVDYAGDIDMFKFTPAETAFYTIESISSFDTYGILYDASGTQVAYNDDGNRKGESTNNRDFYINYLLTADTVYYIAVKAYSSTATGEYMMKVNRKDHYDISGNYMTEGNIDYFGDTDTFLFIPKTDGTYILSTVGETFLDGKFFKVDSNSSETRWDLTSPDGKNVRIEHDMKANEKHYLSIYNKDNNEHSLGAYKVYVETPLTVEVE